jgi:hypothetical protein
MSDHSSNWQRLQLNSALISWLLDSDPAIRWQVMRDLTAAPADEVADERGRVATEGWVRSCSPCREVTASGEVRHGTAGGTQRCTCSCCCDMGLDPASDQAIRALRLVRDKVTWKGCGPQECDRNTFFEGEIEPCINEQVGAVGAYFEQDVRGIIERLLSEQLPDGGWNCKAVNGSSRSSFNTTICVLEALLEYERADRGTPEVTGARLRGQEYLRKAGVAPDERAAEAIDLVASKRDGDGRWTLETRYPGVMPVEIDEGEGKPSRWITLRALRVLDWYTA